MSVAGRVRLLLMLLIALFGASQLIFSTLAFHPTLIYRRDFIQEYLLARAALNGSNPYQPIPELAQQLLDHRSPGMLPNPLAHPPPMVIISLPLGLLSYQQASVVWFLLEIAFVVIAVYLLLRWWGVRPGVGPVVLGALMAFAWDPLTDEMIVGQLNTLLLLLLLLTWQQLRAGKSVAAGIWLGWALSVKFMAWPVALFLLLRRNFRAVAAAGIVIVGTHLLAGALIGTDKVVNYYQEAVPAVTKIYRAHEGNISCWSVGWRVFEGMRFEGQRSVAAPPLVAAPVAARVLSLLLPLLLLLAGLWASARVARADTAFGILVSISLIINPISWRHYLVIAAIPAAIAFRALKKNVWPRRTRLAAVIIGVLLLIPSAPIHELMLSFREGEAAGTGERMVTTVPFVAGMISLIPMLAVLSLTWLLWRLDQRKTAESLTSELQSEMCLAVE